MLMVKVKNRGYKMPFSKENERLFRYGWDIVGKGKCNLKRGEYNRSLG